MNKIYWFVFSNGKLFLPNGKIPCTETPPLPTEPNVMIHGLGLIDGVPARAYYTKSEANDCISLEKSFDYLPLEMYNVACLASEKIHWDKTTQHCPICGARMDYAGTSMKRCVQCGKPVFSQIAPSILVLIKKGKEALLVRAKNFKGTHHGLLAGFVEYGETLEQCVAREVMEETSLKIKNLQYAGSQSWPYPSGLIIGFTAEYDSGEINKQEEELIDAKFFSVNNLPELPPNYTLARILINNWIDEVSTKKKTNTTKNILKEKTPVNKTSLAKKPIINKEAEKQTLLFDLSVSKPDTKKEEIVIKPQKKEKSNMAEKKAKPVVKKTAPAKKMVAPAKKPAPVKKAEPKAPAKKIDAPKAPVKKVSPVKKTVAPKAPAKAPVKKATPVKKTVAPKAPAKAPVKKTVPAKKPVAPAKKPAPVKKVEPKAPAKKIDAPKAPVKKVAPVKKTVAPKAPAKAPVKKTAAPAKKIATPAKKPAPVKNAEPKAPAKKVATPKAPVKKATPVKKAVAPKAPAKAPVKKTVPAKKAAPAKKTTKK